MRVMIKVTIPVERGNAAVSDGSIGKIMQSVMGALKPEAAYFLPMGGERAALIFCDLQDASQIPAAIEPLFIGLNASIEMTPAMNADDLGKGLAAAEAALKQILG